MGGVREALAHARSDGSGGGGSSRGSQSEALDLSRFKIRGSRYEPTPSLLAILPLDSSGDNQG